MWSDEFVEGGYGFVHLMETRELPFVLRRDEAARGSLLLFFLRKRSVSGKKLCSSCGQPLGKGAAMIIETLSLYFHIDCFKVSEEATFLRLAWVRGVTIMKRADFRGVRSINIAFDCCGECGVCKGQLGDTSTGTDVRIRSGLLNCPQCYIRSRCELPLPTPLPHAPHHTWPLKSHSQNHPKFKSPRYTQAIDKVMCPST